MSDVKTHPTAKLRAMGDFKSALANLELLQSDYNRRNFKAACEQLIATGAVTVEDEPEPLSKVISTQERWAIEQAFRLDVNSFRMFDVAAEVIRAASAA
jgi:hypothetical protein